MTRHRRPEWKRPRIPCRPPAALIAMVGIDTAYAGEKLDSRFGAGRDYTEEVPAPEGVYFGAWDYWVDLAIARGWSREQMFSHMRADAVEHQAALAEAEQRVPTAPKNRVGPEEPSSDLDLGVTAPAIRLEPVTWWQRLLRYLGLEKVWLKSP